MNEKAKETMRAGKIEAPEQTSFGNAAIPQLGNDDVLIQVRAAGICGTDIHILKGEYEAQYPLIPGHEFSGIVAGVGSHVTRYQVGDRVTADPNIPCNRCPACQRNEPNQCENLAIVGVTRVRFLAVTPVPMNRSLATGSARFVVNHVVGESHPRKSIAVATGSKSHGKGQIRNAKRPQQVRKGDQRRRCQDGERH